MRFFTYGFSLWLLGAMLVSPGLVFGQDGDPSTRLYDTGSAAATLAAPDLVRTDRWKPVPEGDTSHVFSGEPVFRNNVLLVVLRQKEALADVYALTPDGPRHRASVVIVAGRNTRPEPFAAFRISENTPGAVAITVTSGKTTGGSLSFRLTAGEAILELRRTGGRGAVQVLGRTRYWVVPDYFGDDMVFDAAAPGRVPLPAENTCISLLNDGDSLLMTTWKSPGVQAWVGGAGKANNMPSMTLTDVGDKSVWLAFLEHAGIWHATSGTTKDAWRPPFPAKWRCSLVRHDGTAHSWWWTAPDEAPRRRKAVPAAEPRVVYPLDRTRETPLTASCPTDVMRNTLGVGPCQYILAVEGLSADGGLTPDSVMDWVEKQFRRKRQRRLAGEIQERLDRMKAHVRHVRKRIEMYAKSAHDARGVLAGRGGGEALVSILDDVHGFAEAALSPAASPERAARLADQVAALARGTGSLAECRRFGDELRTIGAIQDRALARCRMAVRRLKQHAVLLAEGKPEWAETASLANRLAERMLTQ